MSTFSIHKIHYFIITIIVLSGCSSNRITDDDNRNFRIFMESTTSNQTEPQIAGVDFYYDTSKAMNDFLTDENFYPLVYSAYSALKEIETANSNNSALYEINDSILPVDETFFTNDIKSSNMYKIDTNNSLLTGLKQINEQNLSVIVTDLTNRLDNYAAIMDLLREKVFEKDLSLGIIGIDTSIRPFFILVTGKSDDVSEFVLLFKQKPDVIAFNGTESELKLDNTNMINYQIFAKQSGIRGIDYSGINVVENGIYYEPFDSTQTSVKPAGTRLSPSGKFLVRDENAGSFTYINPAYFDNVTNTVEGTVNFKNVGEDSQRLVMVKPIRLKDELGKRIDIAVRDIEYISVKSLIDEEDRGLAGKIKLEIPFDIIEGVNLSTLDCSVNPTLYIAKNGKFEEYDRNPREFFSVSIAEGAIPEQGKWRVNDANNSLILNIIMPNAASFPISQNGLYKMNLSFEHFSSETNIASWVKEWDSTKVDNLLNLFFSIYRYQSNVNGAKNHVTLYIEQGDSRTYEQALQNN